MAIPDFHNRPEASGEPSASKDQATGSAAALAESSPQRRPVVSAIRWGAVLAGVAVGLSVQLALTLLGVASGLSTTSVTRIDSVGVGPLIWAGISMLAAAFVGGYVAARMSGLKRKADGVLHGAVSWAVTTILFAVLATSIGGALVGGVFNNMTQLAQVQEQAVEGEGPFAAFMRDKVGMLAPSTLGRLQRHLQNGEREEAVQLLTFAGSMDTERAEAVVDQALILAGAPEAASPTGNHEVQPVPEGAGAAAWIVFGAVALGLLLGMGGGRLGVAGSRRVNWSVG